MMVNEVTVDEVLLVDVGKAVENRGATQPVIGAETWKLWVAALQDRGLGDRVEYERCNRVFKFGNDQMSTAKHMVTFPVKPHGVERLLSVFVVPGSAPLLLARAVLSDWGII